MTISYKNENIPERTLTLKAERKSFVELEGLDRESYANLVHDPIIAQTLSDALTDLHVIIPELNGREYIVTAVDGVSAVNIPLDPNSSRYEIWNESGLYNIYVYENNPSISPTNLRYGGMVVERYYATEAKVQSLQIIADVGAPSFNIRIINRYVEE